VTIGPVVRLWRRARRLRQLPDATRLAQARALVGYRKVILDPDNRTVRLVLTGMQLDLGGIAKGYAADEAMAVLRSHGVTSALVAAAGDIVVSNAPPGKAAWTIGIAPLEGADQPPDQYLELENSAVSTSGDAEQFVEIDGTRYSHIIDPKTGVGLTGHSHVTVVAGDGITADSMATAVSVLGPERGLKLIESTAGAACRIVRSTKDGIEVHESSRFQHQKRQREDRPGHSTYDRPECQAAGIVTEDDLALASLQ
jgi:thiamine biosynthesis lipoprotein